MLDINQFKDLIITPALEDLKLLSIEAIELLIFTCAVESKGGTFVKQVKGSALGIYQMEPRTYNDIWVNYLTHKLPLRLQMIHNFDCNNIPSEDRMIYDLRYATAMARIHYARVQEPLPNAKDLKAIWNYYKLHYNTLEGKNNYHDSVVLYQKFKANY